MGNAGQRAEELFCAGYNCAQATFGAFWQDSGLPLELGMRLASGLGGGLGRQRETCGAVTGMILAAGLLRGYGTPTGGQEKTDTYAMVQALCAGFKKRHGSLLCRELLGLQKPEGTPTPEPRSPQYYAARPCPGLCRDAAQLLEDYLEARRQPAAQP